MACVQPAFLNLKHLIHVFSASLLFYIPFFTNFSIDCYEAERLIPVRPTKCSVCSCLPHYRSSSHANTSFLPSFSLTIPSFQVVLLKYFHTITNFHAQISLCINCVLKTLTFLLGILLSNYQLLLKCVPESLRTFSDSLCLMDTIFTLKFQIKH